jgi:iron complex outermembrane receptor protein
VPGQNIDSTIQLEQITINAYPSKPLLLHSTGSVASISSEQINDHTSGSLIHVINSQPGVRMEERSPGSYRLSIRGSLLRSPFGIRNIKIYMDEFPLTDAGGNTYLNVIDPISVKHIQILKGPEGSLFGANTGGVIVLNSVSADSAASVLSLAGGSYGFGSEHLSLKQIIKKYTIEINQGYMRSDGYRKNSEMSRNSLQFFQKLLYKKGDLKTMFIYSDLNYETPGGLTLQQFETQANSARPATSKLPGAEEQRAAVFNKTTYAGISNKVNIFRNLTHVITVFGSYTDFKNPFITNYEKRFENNLGLRTYLNFRKQFESVKTNFTFGYEGSRNAMNVINHENEQGNAEKILSHNHLSAQQQIFFSQLNLLFSTRLQVELSGSLNTYSYHYQTLPNQSNNQVNNIRLNSQLMPKAGMSYRIINNLVWRASVSKGYSPPTLAEVRPSDNLFHTDLQPEFGWNYETGIRYFSFNQRLQLDLAVFSFQLKDAIVRRTLDTGTEYFINSGGTLQQGIEFQSALILKKFDDKRS